jgi:hypothetical protein
MDLDTIGEVRLTRDQPVGFRAGIADGHVAARDRGVWRCGTGIRLLDFQRPELVVTGSHKAGGQAENSGGEKNGNAIHGFCFLIVPGAGGVCSYGLRLKRAWP